MSPQHGRYLALEQGLGSGVVNLVINGVIAWVMFRGVPTVPLWGMQSIAGDTIGTTFFLPFITTLIVTRIVRGHVRGGRVPTWRWLAPSVLQRLPATPGKRGAVLGGLCIAAVGIPTVLVLGAAGVSEMELWPFIRFKAVFAAVLAAFVTPVIARAALADE